MSQSFSVVMHHNPSSETSAEAKRFIEAAGYKPLAIPYLATGWTLPQLQALFAAAGLTPKTALRVADTPAEQLGLLEERTSNIAILEHMLEYPVLVECPIVCTPKGVRLCRPSETVFSLLERLPKGPLVNAQGALVIDEEGHLVGAAG